MGVGVRLLTLTKMTWNEHAGMRSSAKLIPGQVKRGAGGGLGVAGGGARSSLALSVSRRRDR